MRVFVAGATGVIGVRLVPLLVAAGHTVAGMTRTPAKEELLRALGAEPVVCDVYDGAAVVTAVTAFGPDAVVNELTDLPEDRSSLPGRVAANARIRREGTRVLLAAAEAAGSHRFLAQSVAWELSGDSEVARQELEQAVLHAGGVVLRYGRLYGEGTYYPGVLPPEPRVHADEAARRTVEALIAPSGIVTVVE